MLKNILVGLGSIDYARSATAKAIELAKRHEAHLTGVTLLDYERLAAGTGNSGERGTEDAEGEQRLELARQIIGKEREEFSQACKRAGVAFSLQSESGDPLAALVALARYHDLVICGLQSLFEHGVVAEPADELAKLVQEGVRPLLAVAPQDRPIQRVLIAYSGSMESAKTMKQYVNLRLWPEAELKIITFHDHIDIGSERLESAAAYCQLHGLQPSVECIAEPPLEGLLPYATHWGADLVVLGNSAKNMLLRRILGETALHAMRHSKVPLFLAQ